MIASWDQQFTVSLPKGNHTISIALGALPLAPGQYVFDLGISELGRLSYDVLYDVPFERIINYDQVTQWSDRPWGVLHWDHVTWQCRP